MSQQFKTVNYNLTPAAIAYLVNGDASGMDDFEVSEIDEWFENEFPNATFVGFSPDYDDQNETTDDISGNFASVISVEANIAI